MANGPGNASADTTLVPSMQIWNGTVHVVRWPVDRHIVHQPVPAGTARLWVVPSDAAAPALTDHYEDWVRSPLPPNDLEARLNTLDRRVSQRHHPLTIDDRGVLNDGRQSITLPGVEARLARLLIASVGRVVTRETLTAGGWDYPTTDRRALDVAIHRLRVRFRMMNHRLEAVRGRGYLLHPVLDGSAMRTAPDPV